MTQPCSTLYLQRIDPSRNMSRYYALSIQRNLFGEICLPEFRAAEAAL
uniref:WGR domain-containing protein n=1 Tax=Sinorhizobium sp. M14 TaxID=430451 RepID=A0A142BPE6_9HYPH|nr:hypothetical protein pSinB_089 [Sinorhizobium sp. M14]